MKEDSLSTFHVQKYNGCDRIKSSRGPQKPCFL